MKLEKDIMLEIQVGLAYQGHRVFRNNVGLFVTNDGRRVKTGLCNGSSDLVGWTNKGQFLAIEVKTERGRLSENQKSFLTAVAASGGVGFVAHSLAEALENLSGK